VIRIDHLDLARPRDVAGRDTLLAVTVRLEEQVSAQVALERDNAAQVDPLRLRTTSVTSSRTCGIVENSCQTLSMRMRDTATPSRERSRIRRSELPRVVP